MKVFPEKYVSARVEIAVSDDTKRGEVEEYLLGELFNQNCPDNFRCITIPGIKMWFHN